MKYKITFYILLFVNSLFAQPTLDWVAIYNGPSNSTDKALFLKINQVGEIYVAGESEADLYTIKYSANGDTLWERRYNGAGNDYDNVHAFTLDDLGNAILTGDIWDSLSNNNAFTIKYNGITGNTVWANEVQPFWIPNDDDFYDVDTDSSGNVYVTGKVFAGTHPMGTGNDWLTISYQPIGVLHWQTLWNSPDSLGDVSTSIAVTPGGATYIAGTTTYDDTTQVRAVINGWIRYFPISSLTTVPWPLIAVDDQGNAYITVNSGYHEEEDLLLRKYNSSGDLQWSYRYNSPSNNEDDPVDIAIDSEGNIIIACESKDSTGSSDFCTIKFTPQGDTAWVRRLEQGNIPKALALDRWNNIYVTGNSRYTTVKYTPDGEEDWVDKYLEGTDAQDIEVDNDGNVYVTGYNSGVNGFDFCTIKYSQQTSDIKDNGNLYLTEFKLYQNYPNPFNPTTIISYTVPEMEFVTLKVYDVLGNEVATLVNEEKTAGDYEVEFFGNGLTSGIYFYQLKAGGFIQTKKMVFIK